MLSRCSGYIDISLEQAFLIGLDKLSVDPADMSRQSMAPPRNLTLTEELEKLEQSITLTLQGPSYKHGHGTHIS